MPRLARVRRLYPNIAAILLFALTLTLIFLMSEAPGLPELDKPYSDIFFSRTDYPFDWLADDTTSMGPVTKAAASTLRNWVLRELMPVQISSDSEYRLKQSAGTSKINHFQNNKDAIQLNLRI